MSMEIFKRKDPLEGIDIKVEHIKILNGKSKLSSKKRKIILKHIELEDQINITQQKIDELIDEQKKLKVMREEYTKMSK